MNFSQNYHRPNDAFVDISYLYDIFYLKKDYLSECKYICKLASIEEKFHASILDLGSGTGGHDLFLAQQGYRVTGVDLSEEMIHQAIQKNLTAHLAIDFIQGDIRTIRLQQKFDLVISMFAVMSYQTSNEDVKAALQTARIHLEPGGLFIFDAWYGPAVLRQLPETRIKEFDSGEDRILRIAVPEINTLENKVIVHFQILRLRSSQVIEEIREDHPMRYFFAPEIEKYASETDFKVVKVCPFMDATRTPETRDWNVTWVLKAV